MPQHGTACRGSSRQGCESCEMKVLISSIARFGRIASSMRAKATMHVLLERQTPQRPCESAAVGATWVASKSRGLNSRNDNGPENRAAVKLLGGSSWGADAQARRAEGRCREGRSGQVHLANHRDTGPGIRTQTRRDNVGKGPLAAGADSNLQRPAVRGDKPKHAGAMGSGALARWSYEEKVTLLEAALDAAAARVTPEPREGALGTWRSPLARLP